MLLAATLVLGFGAAKLIVSRHLKAAQPSQGACFGLQCFPGFETKEQGFCSVTTFTRCGKQVGSVDGKWKLRLARLSLYLVFLCAGGRGKLGEREVVWNCLKIVDSQYPSLLLTLLQLSLRANPHVIKCWMMTQRPLQSNA